MLGNILGAVSSLILGAIDSWKYVGVFILILISNANIPIPSEVILPFSGFLVGIGSFSFWIVIIVGVLADLAGSLISYSLASRLKEKITENANFNTARRWFDKFGVLSVFIGKITPMFRSFISFPAGLFRIDLKKFIALTVAGSFIWTTTLTYAGFKLGENWEHLGPYFRRFDSVIAVLLIFGLVFWLRYHIRRKKNGKANHSQLEAQSRDAKQS